MSPARIARWLLFPGLCASALFGEIFTCHNFLIATYGRKSASVLERGHCMPPSDHRSMPCTSASCDNCHCRCFPGW